MQTIQKILSYNFTDEQIETLLALGVVNGCGGKGGYNFNLMLERNLADLEKFKPGKARQLYQDLLRICYEHDYDYYMGRNFYLANFLFAYKLQKLIASWTGKIERLGIFYLVFTKLNKHGKTYYLNK